MGKFEDFDLDINKVKDKGGIVNPDAAPSLGAICTLISGVIIGSVVTGCSADCITMDCSANCPTTDDYCIED